MGHFKFGFRCGWRINLYFVDQRVHLCLVSYPVTWLFFHILRFFLSRCHFPYPESFFSISWESFYQDAIFYILRNIFFSISWELVSKILYQDAIFYILRFSFPHYESLYQEAIFPILRFSFPYPDSFLFHILRADIKNLVSDAILAWKKFRILYLFNLELLPDGPEGLPGVRVNPSHQGPPISNWFLQNLFAVTLIFVKYQKYWQGQGFWVNPSHQGPPIPNWFLNNLFAVTWIFVK